MTEAVIVSGCRTAIGKFLGGIGDVSAPDLGAIVVREAVQRAAVAPQDVDEVILGNILSAGLGQAPARQAALKGGLPPQVAAVTVNKMCGSGLKAVMLAAQAVRLGDAEIVVAGGMENMTRAPFLALGARKGWKFGDQTLHDSMILDGLWCAIENCHMGSAADYIAHKHGIAREAQDRYALESHRRAVVAQQAGEFREEIVPVAVPRGVKTPSQDGTLRDDEGPRADTTLERLARLSPAFDNASGTVTPGNASMLSDGAAAVVVTSAERAGEWQSPLRARIVAYATSGVEPREIFIAPVLAIEKVLQRAGMSAADIDLFEINEAFAAQMLACLKLLKLDAQRVNVSGGAIALGHPIGASGARVLVTLLYALKRHQLKRGLASLCLGGGNAVAMIVEREEGAEG